VISVRVVETEADIDTYVEVRARVHPQTPMPRAVVVDDRRRPGHLDLVAELDGEPVGAASASKLDGDGTGTLAYVSLRVVREARRRGVGTALHRSASEHARTLGRSSFYAVVRADDADSLGYYGRLGYEERGRMQDAYLELAEVEPRSEAPAGIAVVPLAERHHRGAWEVACEAEPDIPSAEPREAGSFEAWHARNLDGPILLRDLSFVALDGDRVVGFALLGRHTDESAEHWMTGVARGARGRGVALALKQAQVAAAKAAGLRFLRTQNDLANGPMRRVNEKLGFEPRFEWVHLVGPLLP
jgi:GNAT superfamily N-acetyltransferase